MRPDPPDLSAYLEPPETLDGDGLREASLTDAAFAGLQAPGLKLDACLLERVVLAGARLRGAELFHGADLTGARFESVELRGPRLDGIRGAASLRGVTMSWDDMLANVGVFAAALGVRVADA